LDSEQKYEKKSASNCIAIKEKKWGEKLISKLDRMP
jgi:hypothetical protein